MTQNIQINCGIFHTIYVRVLGLGLDTSGHVNIAGYSLCLLHKSTHFITSNFTADVREFGEFDAHRHLGLLLQCSVQYVPVCWL